MRRTTANAVLLFLVIIIAAILIAPHVSLDPVAPRWEWSVYGLWLTICILFSLALLGGVGPLPQFSNTGSPALLIESKWAERLLSSRLRC